MEGSNKHTVNIHPGVFRELGYITKLLKENNPPPSFGDVNELINYILASVADGSRRPGSWERQLLVLMGLVASCPEHLIYRAHYGSPDSRKLIR